jgi:hypothetical protein
MINDRLAREANAVHRALFGSDAPEDLRRQYAQVLATASVAAWPERLDLLHVVDRGGDLEAIELALRRIEPRNALTQRFQVVCYLAEARPEQFGTFVNERRRMIAGWASLAAHVVRSALKLLKGRRQIRSHAIG